MRQKQVPSCNDRLVGRIPGGGRRAVVVLTHVGATHRQFESESWFSESKVQ